MDWGRAKTILILVFVALNLFLGVNLAMTKYQGWSDASLRNTLKMMAARGVELPAELAEPSENQTDANFDNVVSIPKASVEKKLRGLSGTGGAAVLKWEAGGFLWEDTPGGNVRDFSSASVGKTTAKLLNSMAMDTGTWVADEVIRRDDTHIQVRLHPTFRGMMIFSSTAVAEWTPSGLNRLQVGLQHVRGGARDTHQVLRLHQLLLNVYPKKTVDRVIRIDLGYYLGEAESKALESIVGPVWRVISERNGTRFYDARTGQQLSVPESAGH